MIFNVTGGGGGSGGTLVITAPAGVTCTVSKDGKVKTKTVDSSGVAIFKGLDTGTWTVTITGDGQTAQKSVIIKTDYSTEISFSTIPDFTYTGDYEIVNDDDQPITASQDNWRIKFLTSGTLTFTNLNGAEDGIDVFCVGGGGGGGAAKGATGGEGYFASGGGGGGGGYTKTTKDVSVEVGVPYTIIVGAGGSPGSDGGTTSAFAASASGGSAGSGATVSAGGTGGDGGSNGGTGGSYSDTSKITPGTDGNPGQGSTTTAFESGSGTKYSGGGGGGQGYNRYGNITSDAVPGGEDTGGDSHTSAAANGGGGGGGGSSQGSTSILEAGSGGSGIVIIRNKR